MRIKAAWDSGPYGYYYPASEGDSNPDVFDADEVLMVNYYNAEKALDEAKDKLQAAYDIHLDALRKVKR